MKHQRKCKERPEDFDTGPRIHRNGRDCDTCGKAYAITYLAKHSAQCKKKEECSIQLTSRPLTEEKEAQFP